MRYRLLIIIVCMVTFNFKLLGQNDVSESTNSVCLILYSSEVSGNPDIYLSDLNGERKIQITNYIGRDGYPSCSPDGEQIAFYSYYDNGATWSICVMDINGENRKRLTHKKHVYDTSPRWSADSKRIIFGRDNNDTLEIWSMNRDGSDLKKFDEISGGTPSYTIDGFIIYCSHWNSSGEICIADSSGNFIKQITNNKLGEWFVDLSLDGNELVFVAPDDIYTMNIDGTNLTQLTNTGMDANPHWSPDGKRILFTSERDGNYNIYVMDKDGSNVHQVTDFEGADIQSNWYIE